MKAKRFLTSKKLRYALWKSTEGKCAICKCELPDNWHADHIVPFVKSQMTNVHDMQPLCPKCNLKKGSQTTMQNIEINYNGDNIRPGAKSVLKSFSTYLKVEPDKRVYSIMMPTRYGKSDIIRSMGLMSIMENRACFAVAVSSSPFLSQQLADPLKMKQWSERYEAKYTKNNKPWIGKYIKHEIIPHNPTPNSEWFISTHIHAIASSSVGQELFKEMIRREVAKGLPPILFFDEVQYYSGSNKWGSVAKEFSEMGCRVVVLTATPYRHDGDDVFGFGKKLSKTKEGKTLVFTSPSDNPDKILLHKQVYDEETFEIQADMEVTFREAWETDCLSKASIYEIDWEVEKAGEIQLLSAMQKSESQKVISTVCRNSKFIDKFVESFLASLKQYRNAGVNRARGIIYSMVDDSLSSGECNAHQKAIKIALETASPGIRVAIATMGSDKEGGNSEKDIRKFCDKNSNDYDVLILKSMGSEGLDCDDITTVGILHNIRSLGKLIQQIMRGGNYVEYKKTFDVIMPSDPTGTGLIRDFLSESGGLSINRTIQCETVQEVDKKPEEEKEKYSLLDFGGIRVIDTDLNELTSQQLSLIEKYELHYPTQFSKFATRLSKPDLYEIACTADYTKEPPLKNNDKDEVFSGNEFVDVAKECFDLNNQIESLVGKIANQLIRIDNRQEPRELLWKDYTKNANSRISDRAGVYIKRSQKDRGCSKDPNAYRKLLMAAKQVYGELSEILKKKGA